MSRPMKVSAIGLRVILFAILGIMVAGTVAIFFFGRSRVQEFALQAQDTAKKAAESESSLQNLRTIEKELDSQEETIARASLIVAESQSYLYQDQIITDITRLATTAGINVETIAFSAPETGQSAAPVSAPADAATPPTTVSGIKSTTATITLENPIGYENMLKFINAIEQSLTKMRIATVSLSKSTGEQRPNAITTDTLTIEVYVR